MYKNSHPYLVKLLKTKESEPKIKPEKLIGKSLDDKVKTLLNEYNIQIKLGGCSSKSLDIYDIKAITKIYSFNVNNGLKNIEKDDCYEFVKKLCDLNDIKIKYEKVVSFINNMAKEAQIKDKK